MSDKETKTRSLALINAEITKELTDPAIVRSLLATTFKDFDEKLMRQAIFEGVIRGFTLKNFLEKDVYALKYRDHKKNVDTYSLITSIGYQRKIAMRSGIIGKSAPQYEVENDRLVSSTVTVKRRIGQDIGEFTATVFFDEYDTQKNQWVIRPRTMIAKVAEAHALRMACPEEMSQVYIEEEFDKEKEIQPTTTTVIRTQAPFDEQEEKPNLLLHQNSREREVDEDVAKDLEKETNK